MKVKKTNQIEPTQINCLIYAPSGYGKTTLAGTLPPKTLVISLESGLLSLMNKDVDYVEIDTSNPINSLRNILGDIEKGDYDNIFIDSLTEIGDAFLQEAKKEFPDARQTMPRFGRQREMFVSFIKYTRNMKKNVFYTCLEKSDKDETGRRYQVPSLVGSIRDEIGAYFDFVFALRVFETDEGEKKRALQTDTRDGYGAKDRSGKLNEYEPADLGLIINKVFNNQQGE